MGVVSQDVAVHALASSVTMSMTVSARALSARCFHVICIFGLTYMHIEIDILPYKTNQAIV